MTDFLNNPEEIIASFNNSTRKKKNATIEDSRLNNKDILSEENRGIFLENKAVVSKHTFTVKVDKELEIPIRTALLEIYQSTGKKISIQQFIGESVKLYLKDFTGKKR